MPALWELSFTDIGLSGRARGILYDRNAWKPWHAAILCQKCIRQTYQCGPKILEEISTALPQAGFPPLRRECGSRPGRSRCQETLEQCCAMLERGEWN